MPLVSRINGSYYYEQATASDTWTIVHNLNTDSPVVDCWVDVSGSKTKLLPLSVDVTDANTVVLTFTATTAGEALVV
jgi:hypothetical protein